MIVFRYDHTFEGLLSAVFDAYSRKQFPDALCVEGEPLPLFCQEVHTVITGIEQSERVWQALERKLSAGALGCVTRCWLSDLPEAGILLFRYLCKTFNAPASIEMNFTDPDVLQVAQIAKKVAQECQRIKQFARFQKAADGTFFAAFELLYNALPLAVDHFRDRFADQSWLLYDLKRNYGYYYDRTSVTEITLEVDNPLLQSGHLMQEQMAQDEALFQELWRGYFHATAIRERTNPRKQRQDMPVRFWKFLTEKNG